jgi:hydroxymethylpyrimidine pyrophosphatase-like HAD family hydrolase
MKGNNEFYSEGSRVAPQTLEAVHRLYREIEESGKTPWLMFDVDGVLIKAGLETPTAPETLAEYIEAHTAQIASFKKRIENLKKRGFHIALNTGRGFEFANRVATSFFPEASVDGLICESGAIIVLRRVENGKTIDERKHPAQVSAEGVATLTMSRANIIAFAKSIGGQEERGNKEVIVSLNPHPSMKIEDFFTRVRDFITSHVSTENIDITHSKTAVDIAPKGIDKLAALKQVEGDGVVVYFGDSPGDEKAMTGAVINVTPHNAFDSTKRVASQASIGIVAEGDEISGITDALYAIEVGARFAKVHFSKTAQ